MRLMTESEAKLLTANDDLVFALAALLAEAEIELEQRKASGLSGYYADLQVKVDAGHAALANVREAGE